MNGWHVSAKLRCPLKSSHYLHWLVLLVTTNITFKPSKFNALFLVNIWLYNNLETICNCLILQNSLAGFVSIGYSLLKLIIRVWTGQLDTAYLSINRLVKVLAAALHERHYENEQEAKGELSNKSPVVGWSFVQCWSHSQSSLITCTQSDWFHPGARSQWIKHNLGKIS